MRHASLYFLLISMFTACDDASEHDVETSDPVGKGDDVEDDGSEAADDFGGADLIVNATGLHLLWDGTTVNGRIGLFPEANSPISSGTVEDGSFTLTFPGQYPTGAFGVFVTVHFDGDGDGACGSEDLVQTSFISGPLGNVDTVEGTIDFLSSFGTWRSWCESFEGFESPQSNIDCESSCASRGDSICFSSSDCETFCEESVLGQSEALQEAFVGCMEQNPMCFDTPWHCVEARLEQD